MPEDGGSALDEGGRGSSRIKMYAVQRIAQVSKKRRVGPSSQTEVIPTWPAVLQVG